MSYIVLARKYRPQTFAEVYAQEHITEVLQNAILSNRIAHAYLFTGPRGVGKTSMARILAKSLNCVEGPTITPCNKCHNCVEIAAGISADVIEIDGASNTGVDDIRELQRELLYAPSQSSYKIYIIDEVHMLSKNAF
ncbi:AAA family ATPase, partial [Candidatus Syntrophosphaera thermopropionivorans]